MPMNNTKINKVLVAMCGFLIGIILARSLSL
jgi:hypothetical protein